MLTINNKMATAICRLKAKLAKAGDGPSLGALCHNPTTEPKTNCIIKSIKPNFVVLLTLYILSSIFLYYYN